MNKLKILLVFFSAAMLLCSCTKTQIKYYENGMIKSSIPYKFGKENGLAVYFDEYGNKVLEVEMKHGKKNGSLVRFNFNGRHEAEEYYENDILEGKQIIYDLLGDKIVEANYIHGLKNGPYTTWHSKDMLREKGAFVDDFFDGEWEYFDERGFNIGEGSFKKGTGSVTFYDSHGNLMKVTHYLKNKKEGKELSYDANGSIIKTVIYKNDRITSINGKSVEEIEIESDTTATK